MTKGKLLKITGGTALGTAVAGLPGMLTGLFITLGTEAVEKIKNCIESTANKFAEGDEE